MNMTRNKLICLKCVEHNIEKTVKISGLLIHPLVTNCEICGCVGVCISVSQIIQPLHIDDVESWKAGEKVVKTTGQTPSGVKAVSQAPIDSMKVAKESVTSRAPERSNTESALTKGR